MEDRAKQKQLQEVAHNHMPCMWSRGEARKCEATKNDGEVKVIDLFFKTAHQIDDEKKNLEGRKECEEYRKSLT